MKDYKVNGFTLIELMIVIAILAIVTSIAIPAYNGYIASARMTEAKNNIAALVLAEEEFFLENNTYFHNDNGTDNALLANRSSGLWAAAAGEGGNVNFNYTVSATARTFSIVATGRAGTPVAGRTENYP